MMHYVKSNREHRDLDQKGHEEPIGFWSLMMCSVHRAPAPIRGDTDLVEPGRGT